MSMSIQSHSRSTGLYHISYNLYDEGDNNRHKLEGQLLINDIEKNVCLGTAYHRNTAVDDSGTASSCYIELNASDVIKIRAVDTASTSDASVTTGDQIALSVQSMDAGAGSGSSNETNTSYTTYTDVSSAQTSINNITITVEVDSYNPAASVDQGTNDPDLWLEVYNGSDFVEIGNFSLPATYTGTGLDTTNYNFSLITTDASILTAWQTVANQDLRIMGRYMDHNGSVADEINYTNVWIAINAWGSVGAIGNHTEGSTFTWNLSAVAEQSGIDLSCRAIDLDGSNTYSAYYNPAINLTITSTDSSLPLINWINTSPSPVDPGNTINFTANITDVSSITAWIDILGTNYSMNSIGDIFYYDQFDTFISPGL